MSQSEKHEVRRRYQETRRAQLRRLAEIFEGAIMLHKQAVVVPACDYPLLFELISAHEHRLVAEEQRQTRLEIISMFEELSTSTRK